MPRSARPAKNREEFRYAPSMRDVSATQGMLHLVRNELKSEMKAGFKSVDARFNQMESRFNQIDSKFNENESRFSRIEARFNEVDARFDQMESKFEQVLSEVARIGILVEEQNSNNRIVLEGLTGLWQRQEKFESRLVEEVQRAVAAAFVRR